MTRTNNVLVSVRTSAVRMQSYSQSMFHILAQATAEFRLPSAVLALQWQREAGLTE